MLKIIWIVAVCIFLFVVRRRGTKPITDADYNRFCKDLTSKEVHHE